MHIKDNISTRVGGGIHIKSSHYIEINSVIIENNIAETNNGGGILIDLSSDLIAKELQLSYNYAESGAGIYIAECYGLKFESVKIVKNKASLSGGGIFLLKNKEIGF